MDLTQRSSLSAVALAKAEGTKKVVERDGSIAPHAEVKRVKLGEVCEISRKEFLCDDVNVWLLNLDMIEQQTGRVIERVVIPRNDIGQSTVTFDAKCVLYSKLRPNLNKVVLPETEGFATSELLPLVPISEMATREYIAAFLRSETFVRYATSKSYGAKMPRLGTKDLLAAEIPLPPLSEQRRIAAVLDKISEMKRNVEARLKKLDLLVKARFNEMFGDEEVRSGGVGSGGVDFNAEAQRRRELEMVRLGDVASLKAGKFISAKDIKVKGSYPCYGGNGIRGWVLSYNQEGEFPLIGRQGALCGNVQLARGRFYATEHAVVVKPLVDWVPVYMYYMLMGMKLGRYATGAAQPGLSVGKLEELSVSLPPLPLQRKFAAFVEKVEALKAAAKAELEKVDLLYRAKLQEYFG